MGEAIPSGTTNSLPMENGSFIDIYSYTMLVDLPIENGDFPYI